MEFKDKDFKYAENQWFNMSELICMELREKQLH
jgi:hypothetical protein